MIDYCEHCPVAKASRGTPCPGRTAIPPRPAIRRYCELVDPAHPAYMPGYDAAVLQSALPTASEPTYPTLARQMVNAASAAARFVASGCKLASDDEVARRLAICHACDQYDAARDRCRKCGCWMVKSRAKSEDCPLGKWAATEPTTEPSNSGYGS